MSAVIEFTPDTTPVTARSLKPTININQKSGTLSLNHAAAEFLGINAKNKKIKLLFLEESPEDFYLVVDPKGFELRPKSTDAKAYWITNSSFTAKAFCKNNSIEANSATCLIQAKPIKVNKQDAHLLLIQRKS